MKYAVSALISFVVCSAILFTVFPSKNTPSIKLGDGDQISGIATTTGPSFNAQAANLGGFKMLRSGYGILDCVMISNETLGSFTLYDGTTTVNGAIYATTTLFTTYPSLAENNYCVEIQFQRGLVMEFQSPNVASSTIYTH